MRGDSQPWWRARWPVARAVAAISIAAALTLLAAACGGSPSGHVAQLGSTTTQTSSPSGGPSSSGSTHDQALAYADCLRTNGVRNWPDPSSSGVFDKSKLTLRHLGLSGSQFRAAQSACRHLLPNGGRPPNQAERQQIRAQALRFSQCVRAHGVTSFPDPDSSGRIPDPARFGIDQGSPQFQAANQACRKYRPPYLPSNAAYNSWARTRG